MDTYEKKYKEANDKIAARFGTNVAKEIFTDLYESEDEKVISTIKKALEAKIEDLGNGVTKTACLAWLEKQQKPAWNEEGEKIRKEIMDFIDTKTIDSDERRNRWFSYLEKYKPISFISLEDTKVKMSLIQYISELNQDVVHLHPGIETCNEWIAWLEKQGEHANFLSKIQIGDKVTRNEAGILVNISQLNRVAKPAKRQGEQKLTDKIKPKFHEGADKVEPKFKVGDWIVWDNKISCHIDNIYQGKESLMYTITDVHNMTRSYSVKGFDNNAHLWTIEDAKEGDVLCTYECDEPKIVFVLKGAPKKHYALSYYCFYNIMYPHFDDGNKPGCLAPEDSDVKPATKEQRDLLFQKMKEAGYEWNAENKELKKIELKSAWSEEFERMCQETIDWFEKKCFPYALENDNPARESIKWLKSLKQGIGGE